MSSTEKIRWTFRLAAVVLGAAQVAVSWNDITPDGISYLDLARAYLRHDWPMTINAYWGPVYSWLLAAVFGIFKPGLRWEFPLAHALQFVLLLGALAGFEYFWGNLLQRRRSAGSRAAGSAIPDPAMWALGYSLFIWLTIGEVVSLINPDLLLTIEILLLAGMLVRIASAEGAGWSCYSGFGLLLGFGYLTKAVMFPLAFVFVSVCALARHSPRERLRLSVMVMVFLAIAVPWISLLSHSKGRITFSDTGRLNFAWFNYGLPYVHWQGQPPDSGTAAHPTRQVFASPALFEFNGPLRASYPPWYDPSYWNEGLSPRLRAWAVTKHAALGLSKVGYRLFLPVAWLAGIAVLFLSSDFRSSWRGALTNWPLLAVSSVALGLYAMTLVVARYLAPWEVLIWGAVLAGIRGRRLGSTGYRWVAAGISAALVIGAGGNIVRWPSVFGGRDNAKPDYTIAEGLNHMGLRAGDKVGSIGYDYQGYWAYLDRLSVVAEIRGQDACQFWRSVAHAEILSRFAQAGAVAVIANGGGGVKVEGADGGCVRPDAAWRKIEGSRDYVYFLK